jgi:hypothetical protein
MTGRVVQSVRCPWCDERIYLGEIIEINGIPTCPECYLGLPRTLSVTTDYVSQEDPHAYPRS